MAGQTLTLTIASQLQAAGFTAAADHLKNLQGELRETTKEGDLLADMGKKIVKVFEVTAVLEFMRRSIDAAQEAEQAEMRLKTAVESTGLSWRDSRASVLAYTDALAKSSRFQNDQVQDALRILVQKTGDLSVAQNNLRTVMGISVATGRDLADVADQVGRAANGSERDTMQLAKAFGIAKTEWKDSAAVLEILRSKFGDLATTENTSKTETEKMKNTWHEFMETLGTAFLPIWNFVVKSMARGIEQINSGLFMTAGLMQNLMGVLTLNRKMMSDGFKTMEEGWKKFTNSFRDDTEEIAKKSGPLITKSAAQMSEQLKAMLRDIAMEKDKLGATTEQNDSKRLERELAAYRKATMEKAELEIRNASDRAAVVQAIDEHNAAARLALAAKHAQDLKDVTNSIYKEAEDLGAQAQATDALRLEAELTAYKVYTLEKMKNEIQTEEARLALLNAIDARAAAARTALAKKEHDDRVRFAVDFGSKFGQITGRMLAGEAVGWQDYANLAIDSLTQVLEASIISGAARTWIESVAGLGWAGIAVGAALAAAVNTVGAAAKGAMRGGGGSASFPSSAGGFSGGLGSSEAASAPAAPQREVRVNIYGDLYNDNSFMNKIAKKLSDAVQNNDVRLVASQTKGAL